jgi:hypothetical protein
VKVAAVALDQVHHILALPVGHEGKRLLVYPNHRPNAGTVISQPLHLLTIRLGNEQVRLIILVGNKGDLLAVRRSAHLRFRLQRITRRKASLLGRYQHQIRRTRQVEHSRKPQCLPYHTRLIRSKLRLMACESSHEEVEI